jgi:hypothetical protein
LVWIKPRGWKIKAAPISLILPIGAKNMPPKLCGAFERPLAQDLISVKLGFKQSGSGMAKSQARLEPAPVNLYRLKLEDLKA